MDKSDMPHIVDFKTKIEKKNLIDFQLYQNYHSISGALGLLFALVVLAVIIITAGKISLIRLIILLLLEAFLILYTPIQMIKRVNSQTRAAKQFAEPVRYIVTEEKIQFSQNDIIESVTWNDVCKIKCTGKNMILYISNARVNIIPLESLGKKAEAFLNIAEKKLKPFQMEIKKERVIKKADRLFAKRCTG